MGATSIEWTDEVWNPVTGCTKVSEGCRHCYAERLFPRVYGRDKLIRTIVHEDSTVEEQERRRTFTDVACHPERLSQPLHWRKPRRVFVNSMSDLFHEDVPYSFTRAVLNVCDRASAERGHVFQVLTKRPYRMRDVVRQWVEDVRVGGVEPNIPWLGVSVEDQKTADERIPLLLETPAAVRFVSCEPLLGPLDMGLVPNPGLGEGQRYYDPLRRQAWYVSNDGAYYDTCPCSEGIDWVIVGGESGPQARPMHPDWALALRDQCRDAGVPFFFKQWGEWAHPGCRVFGSGLGRVAHIRSDGSFWPEDELPEDENADVLTIVRAGKKLAGRDLGGRTWDEMPEPASVEAAL